MKKIKVISLFDGLGGARIALNRIGIECDYYASEIDKWAIKIARKNYPDIIQVGNIEEVDYKNGILITEKGIYDIGKVDLLVGGSPCQGFSSSGKGLNFNDPRSKLFFEFVRLLIEIKPKYFLLENVKMKNDWIKIINGIIGVEPIEINSALVTAQNRKRLYWVNIEGIEQPKDKGILLKDIILDGFVDRSKSLTVTSTYRFNPQEYEYTEQKRKQMVFGCWQVGRRLNENGKRDDYNKDIPCKQLIEINETDKSNCVSTVLKDNIIMELDRLELSDKNIKKLEKIEDVGYRKSLCKPTEKSFTIDASYYKGIDGKRPYIEQNYKLRRLHPIECERLQGLDDRYTEGVSNTQRYKMIGNGFTIPVIEHILSYAKF